MLMALRFFGQHLQAPSSVQLLSQSSHPWCIQLKTYFWPLSNPSYRVGNIFKALALEGLQGGEPCPSCLSSSHQMIHSLWSPPKQRPTHRQGWLAGRESKVRNFNFLWFLARIRTSLINEIWHQNPDLSSYTWGGGTYPSGSGSLSGSSLLWGTGGCWGGNAIPMQVQSGNINNMIIKHTIHLPVPRLPNQTES